MGTWIEIWESAWILAQDAVVPYVGTWIEIGNGCQGTFRPARRSLRGNVDRNINQAKVNAYVASVVPYVGTWIEISSRSDENTASNVVPYVGTWIEILQKRVAGNKRKRSFPTWERG